MDVGHEEKSKKVVRESSLHAVEGCTLKQTHPALDAVFALILALVCSPAETRANLFCLELPTDKKATRGSNR